MSNKPVVTRFPPSPTGYMHIGRARTALFNYLFAKHHNGKLIFRLEDTDKERSKKEYENDIVSNLAWLGLAWDNSEIYRQSERTEIYKKYLEKMLHDDKAYVSTEKHPDTGVESEVIRFKNPKNVITFTDLIRGEIQFNTTDLGDFIIARTINDPLYHLTVVVDDHEMGITHVIRGEDGISNTPRQILLQEALGMERPQYAHIPLILAADRSKLSGRHGAVSVNDFKEQGYLPQAIINFLALLGWSPQAKTSEHAGTDQELFSLEELIERFSLEGVQKSGALFDIKKLNWLNKEYLKKLSPEELLTELKKYIPQPDEVLKAALPVIIDHINTFKEAKDLYEAGEFDYFFKAPTYMKELLKNQDHFVKIIEALENSTDWNAESIKNTLWDYATEQGRGNVLWPMRVALSGKERSADPFTIAAIIGKEETLKRLTHAKNL